MALRELPRFGRGGRDVPPSVFEATLLEHRFLLQDHGWTHCGYASPPALVDVPVSNDVTAAVNNAFRLGPMLGFERTHTIVTTGLRSSIFAPILFWEVLHALAPGGVWIDIDDPVRCDGTSLAPQDFPRREYFAECLRMESQRIHESFLVQTWRKTAPTALAAHVHDTGWTFGILTSGPSPRAAQMATAILALDLPQVEVIFCGPRPGGLPDSERIRAIDLERPEPRGWITRKKNLIADAARYENLCLLHDRYVVTRDWADALTAYGPCFAFLTCPQVYHAGMGRRFPQRYPDYQLLDQRTGLADAMAFSVYDSERVFHPAYDDFSETAFCCGGLYIAKRSLWNRVRQDEALYHCEWEDITFGLDCQRRGLPHRVNPFLTAESVVPHPLLLTRIHTRRAPGDMERGRLHVAADQEAAAATAPCLFTPLLPVPRHEYYASVLERFNALPILRECDRLTPDAVAGCTGLADFWDRLERQVNGLPLVTREDIARIAGFLQDAVYKWPAPQVQSWIRRHEQALVGATSLARFDSVVGWGTGSAFRAAHRRIGRDLTCVFDRQPASWGTTVDGVTVRPPAALANFDPATTAVVVFSCYVDDIAAAVRAHGPFTVIPATELVEGRRFQPLADLVSYYREVERYYPALFVGASVEAAA